jgi:hypothetical protein
VILRLAGPTRKGWGRRARESWSSSYLIEEYARSNEFW